jgi:hypothetical protein
LLAMIRDGSSSLSPTKPTSDDLSPELINAEA